MIITLCSTLKLTELQYSISLWAEFFRGSLNEGRYVYKTFKTVRRHNWGTRLNHDEQINHRHLTFFVRIADEPFSCLTGG